MRHRRRMSQNTKAKNKKSKEHNESSNLGDKLNKKFRLSFRGNKSKKERNKMTKGEDEEECASDNILGDYNKDNLGDYLYLCNNNSSNLNPKIDCQRELTCDNEVERRNEQNKANSRGVGSAHLICEEDESNEDDLESDETLDIVSEILDEIFSAVVIDHEHSENDSEISESVVDVDETDSMCKEKVDHRKRLNSDDDRQLKAIHRRTSVADENFINSNFNMRETARRDSLYSVEEFDEELDENDNCNSKVTVQAINQVLINQIGTKNFQNSNQKTKKKSFLTSFFGKSKRDKKPEPSKSKSLVSSRKYSSTFELSQRILEKSPSFIRKSIRHVVNKDVPSLLKRSFSVRDVEKKKEKQSSREKLTEMKNLAWARSLQNLVENDNSVSYDDMSFINYDTLNTVSYNLPRPPMNLHRTQSLIVHGSPGRNYQRAAIPTHYQSAIDISEQSEALSLPSLQYAIRENEESVYDNSPPTRYRRRPQSISSEDGKGRTRGNGSFRSAGSGCAKLKRTNACRQKSRDSLPLFVEQRNSQTNFKIARESLNIEPSDQEEGKPHEWRRLVGSIRRRVQRHASSSGSQEAPPSTTTISGPVSPQQSISRKNSLTQSRFDFFKKNKDDSSKSFVEKSQKPLTRQKSVEHNPTPKVQDYFKALTSKDKSKSVSVKNVHSLASPTSNFNLKGVRKSDKMLTGDKTWKPGFSIVKRISKKDEKNANRDDFLKATMRIFLVVSPPVGKLQVRSRSLNHLDTLDMRYGVQCASDTTLKDSKSEPDCTRPLLAPPAPNVEPPSPTIEAPISRRHVLSRSQKSSSECFSVNFEVGDESTWENELFYPAMRGVTLLDALANQSELRSIDLSNCDAWLQDRESNTNSLISFSQDTASLVGRHIRITAKDPSSKRSTLNHSKKFSGSYRPKASSFFSSSTEENTATTNWPQDSTRLSFQDADNIKKQGKQRWSGFFSNNKDTRMEQLTELLNNYTTYGVPSSQIYPQGQVESVDALYKLEGDWREIVSYKELPERQQQQQTALWELIKTEVAYIKTLKVVTDLFLACLKNLQSEGLLKEIDTEKLFSNITEILDTNVLFWRNSLFPMVRDMRNYRQPPCIETMLQGFLCMKDSFRAYFRYCAEQARCQHYCRENNLHNESFAAYLAWCETQKECNRLRLMDILVQPMQRLTKYGLLLKAILKNTEEEVERDSLEHMIKSVDDFVNNVNSSLKQRQDTERLKGLIVRIESYDVVETKDDDLEKLLRSYSPLDLNRPMINCPPERKRHLLLEGDLKLKDNNTSKMEVHCFLLTDILLVCKPSTKKGVATMRVIRQPYLVDRLDVTDLNKETPTLAVIYKNEFNMPVAAFILQNNDAKKLKSWKESIAKAQALYAQAKQPTYLEESLDTDYGIADPLETEFHSLQLAPRSPLASSSRASRVSSLAHSHSGSVEMNDQSSVGSGKDHSRAVSVETENRTASISSDEGVQPLPPDRSPVSQKNSFKMRLFSKTPNTLSVQPYTNLGQSLPNLALGSPNVGTLSLNLNQNTLSVPNTKNGGHLLSPTHRGISYPPPSPTRGNLRRGLAISQSKNPPLLKTRHVNSSSASTSGQVPASFDFDVPVIAGVSPTEQCENFSRGQLRQAMVKRGYRSETKRYHTAGVVDDIKRNDNRDANIHKRLSLNYNSQEATLPPPPSSQEET